MLNEAYFIPVNVSYQSQNTILIFKNRVMDIVGIMMNINGIKLWELIKVLLQKRG